MKKSIKALFAIILMTAAALTAGCGMVNTERDSINDPRSGSYQFPNLVLKADGEEIENGEACFLSMTEVSTTREITFIIENNGNYELKLEGALPVEITGEGTSLFSGLSQPNLNTLAPGDSTFFTAQYSPADLLNHSLRMSIDTREGTFTCYICCADLCGKVVASDGAEDARFGNSVSISGERAIVGAYWDDDNGDYSGSAYVYKWNGTTWGEEHKLTASDGAAGDRFGKSVSISGERVIVGADGDDDDKGSAYVFKWNGTAWEEEGDKLTASDGAADDRFGGSVSISGDRAIVGAFCDDDDKGSAYVFKWNGTAWEEEGDKLTASDGAADDYFGLSVSISGDRAIVGAKYDDDNGSASGSAWVYKWNGTTWVEEQKLTASDGAASDHFGISVSISGDRAIVGADGDDDKGSAYVFKWNGSAWVEEKKLTASDGAENDGFGCSVSISGDRAIVGVDGDDDNGDHSGSAWVYKWNGTTWVEGLKLTASDGVEDDGFGCSVSISGDRAIVGAPYDDDNGDYSGSAYVYKWNGSAWVREGLKLTASDGAASDHFGISVSISGDRAIVGAKYDDDNGSASGSAWVYKWNGTTWVEEQKLTASDGAEDDYFGNSVFISGDRAIVGAYADDDKGSAYVFKWNGSAWVEEQKLTALDGAANDWFGYSVSISGDRAIVGAYKDDDKGSAYVFNWNGTTWVEEQKLTASDGAANDWFGYSVSISGDRAIVGAYGDDNGSAYVFNWNGNTWVEEQKLTASDGAASDHFGWSVSISGDRVIVGAIGDDDMGDDSGSAYVYKWNGSAWVREGMKLTASEGDTYDCFGYSVSISGDRAIVGAEGDDIEKGSACVYKWNGTSWVEEQKLTASDGAVEDEFGGSVSISGDRAIVGANYDDDNGSGSGSVYIYQLLTR